MQDHNAVPARAVHFHVTALLHQLAVTALHNHFVVMLTLSFFHALLGPAPQHTQLYELLHLLQ
jgi:hypothetical protein